MTSCIAGIVDRAFDTAVVRVKIIGNIGACQTDSCTGTSCTMTGASNAASIRSIQPKSIITCSTAEAITAGFLANSAVISSIITSNAGTIASEIRS